MPDGSSQQLLKKLKNKTTAEIYYDNFTRGRYSTDASIYQMMPYGVLIPKKKSDLIDTINYAREAKVPLLARGGGTSQCGQTVNEAIIIDNSKFLNKILDFNKEKMTCIVEPGIVLDELNRFLKPFGLWFPVDVSTSSRATIGGMTGNNSCGGRSIRYGMMRDNVLEIEGILSDGSTYKFGHIKDKEIAVYLFCTGKLKGDDYKRLWNKKKFKEPYKGKPKLEKRLEANLKLIEDAEKAIKSKTKSE